MPEEDIVFVQEIDLVLTADRAVTVRKTPPGRAVFDSSRVGDACAESDGPGVVAYHVADEVAERYLDLLDDLVAEVEELEDNVERWTHDRVRRRLSELRHDVVTIRRTLAPTRDAVRRVVDGRLDLDSSGEQLFDRPLELRFADAHDKLLRAAEHLELARELIAAAREYHQSRIATEQNEIVKKLAVVASLVLLPTFVVGVYGQNFEHMPELGWRLGYAFSWAIIVASTVAQLVFFRRKRWI